jgi:ubiquinone/menaquinone biosynthesis C-methylase UbiE
MDGTGGFLHPEEIVKQLNIKRWMKVADFGCGSGYFTLPIANRLAHESRVYAIDVLETALESVRSRARLQGLFNIETIRCNLEEPGSTGLSDKSMDFVLLANILFQSSKKVDIIKEAKRVLKEGGEIAIIDWKPDQPMGPAKDFIVPLGAVKKIVEGEGLKFKRELAVDKYHWGLVFEK